MVARRRHEGSSSSTRLAAVCAARSTDVSGLHRKLRGDLDTICLMALRPERERRYQSAGELAEDVRRFLQRLPVHAQPDQWAYRVRKFASRHRVAVTLAAAFLVVTVALTAVYAVRLGDERDRARAEAAKARQVTAFLTSLFNAADPNVSKGPDLTVKELLGLGRDRISATLAGQPELQAVTLEVIGRSYHQLGEFETARRILEESLKLLVTQLGWNRTEVAVTLNDMGNLLYDLGEYDSAVVCGRRALATVLREQGKFDEAIELRRKGLADMRGLVGEEHHFVGSSLAGLAWVMYEAGRFEEADSLFRAANANHERTLPEAHVNRANSLLGLGSTLLAEGRPAEAEQPLRQAVALRQEALGIEHYQTAEAQSALGECCGRLGKRDEARTLLTRAVATLAEALGPDHRQTMEAHRRLEMVDKES